MNPHKHWAELIAWIAFLAFITLMVLLYNNHGHWPF